MKVLIISHNCISNYNNMGKAMLSIMSSFKKAEVCQLYIYPSLPDIDICNSYYRITDKELLNLAFFNNKKGKVISKEDIKTNNMLLENNGYKKYYQKKKNIFKKYARDMIWMFPFWFNDDLKQWLKKEKPTHIVAFPGDYCFFYNIVLKIGKYLNIPIVTYMMDDYYNLQFDNIIEKKYQYLLNKKIKKIVLTSKLVLTLSHEMSSYYEREFNKKIETLMLGSNTKKIKIKSQKNKIKNLSYIGNISNQRYLNLIDIGKALDDINKEENKNYLLNIYSNVQDDSILNLFKTVESIKYWGFVKGKEYERAINNADILIHVESFNDETIDLIKHSISTKISESLSSGKCLLAYGPSNVASFSFLNNTNSAFIINKDDDLKYKLQQLLNDDKLRKKIIDNAYKTVEKYQNAEKNSKILYNLLERINSI